MQSFDVVIIGSGIGGLVCGNLLSKEGYRVCVLEKNKQIGGCLQIFVRNKVIFDSGVHYIGGLDAGQNLHQIFKYLDVMDALKLERLDPDAFDKIIIEHDEKEYAYAQGYDHFIRTLSADFPRETRAIEAYCAKIKEVCGKFPLYNLRRGSYDEKTGVLGIDAQTFIESLTDNKKLQAVLAGNNILYAGRGYETPFYVHALILNSYIESSWKCIDGGSQIARIMARNIRAQGGVVQQNSEVKKIAAENETIQFVELADGSRIYGKRFISSIHPAKTMELIETPLIKNAYRNRLKNLPNTVSSFMLNLVLKKNTVPYRRYNYYYHREGHIWTMADYTPDNWPLGYALYFSPSDDPDYAEAITVLTYMRYEEVKEWEQSFNTVSVKSERGRSYEDFKKNRAEKLLDCVSEKFPGLRDCIESYATATPLSYRDYLGSYDGSLYGIAKDYKDPVKTLIAPRTKLANLYLTGQNLNLHGILGTAISGLITCATLMGRDDFIEKIKNA